MSDPTPSSSVPTARAVPDAPPSTGADIPTRPGPSAPPFPFLGPPARPLDLGTLGPYRVVSLLGAGGMGFVFRAEDDTLRRPVALKVLRQAAAGPGAAERFLREARAAAGLKSDHVVTVYAVGEADGLPYLAMELLDGCTLDEWLGTRPAPAPPAAVVRVAKDVLRGLAVAHGRGLVHRDVKPANLWVEAGTHRVKLLDFGLTRDATGADSATRVGAFVGTPGYASPEQANGTPVDGRADLFSLGCVLYRMIAGRPPFQRNSFLATVAALATETAPRLDAVSPGVPADLAAFVARLLAKNPADRPPGAAAALVEVRAVEARLRPPPAGAAPDPWAELAVLPPSARPPNRAAGLLLGATAGLLAVVGAAVVLTCDPPAAPPTPPEVAAAPPRKPTPRPTVPTPSRPEDDPGQRAARMLRAGGPVSVATREETYPSGNPLPETPLAISHVVCHEPLPADFVEIRLLPAAEHLGGLFNLECPQAACSAGQLERLAGTPLARELQYLTLGFEPTPEHTAALARFPKLRGVGCRVETFGDDGLVQLAKLPDGMTGLTLRGVGQKGVVTRAGWAALATRHLSALTVETTTFPPDAAREVARIPGLEQFILTAGDAVSDESLGALAAAQGLKWLHLNGCAVTDAGLLRLADCRTLAALYLNRLGPGVTEAGVAAVSAASPACEVVWDGKVWTAGRRQP